jgi:hypothetical protein
MKGIGEDKEGNFIVVINDEIILAGPYWDTIGVNPDIYKYQATNPKIVVSVNKLNGNPLEFVESVWKNGQLLVNDASPKAFNMV